MGKLSQLLLGFGISALAVVFLLRQVSLDELGAVITRADAGYVAVTLAFVLIALVIRAVRWQVYFRPEHAVSMRPIFGTLAISYMASTFLPFRAGELVRGVFLARRTGIPFPRIVGTILLEKLFDFLALAVFLAVLLATTPVPTVALVAGTSVVTVVLVGFGFVVALALWRAQTLAIVTTLEGALPRGLSQRLRITRMVRQFAEGTDSLRDTRLWLPMLGWTAGTWICSFLAIWAGLAAVGVIVNWAAAAYVIILTSTGQAVPSSPGYVGVFHAAAVLALTTFGVGPAEALGAAVLIHAATYGLLVLVGLAALWLGGYGFSELLAARSGAPSEPAPARAQTAP